MLVLAKSFLNQLAKEYNSSVKSFSADAIAAMEGYGWPGNVRELESKVKRGVIMADGAQVSAEDMELAKNEAEPMPLNLREVREDAERRAIVRAMNHCDQNITDAANALGITRPTLYNLLEKLGLKS